MTPIGIEPDTSNAANAPRDCYAVLGVPRGAGAEQIRSAFRTLAQHYHPDRNKATDTQDKFKELAAAFAVLSDPDRRHDYDARGDADMASISQDDLLRSVDLRDLLNGLGFDLSDRHGGAGGGLFEAFFGRRQPAPARGDNIEVEVQIPLARVVSGGEETVDMVRNAFCTACQGSGARAGTLVRTCPSCQGAGSQTTRTRRHEAHGEVIVQHITPCIPCQSRGHLIDHPCPECQGSGKTASATRLTVNVPIGAEEGMVLRLPGQGQPSAMPEGVPGDLFVTIRTQRDPRFGRSGADLWRDEPLTVSEAALGTERQVPTLEAPMTVTIEAGTQPDTIMRLVGRGLPEFGRPGRGDLYLRFQVIIPAELSPGERTLYERLRTLETVQDPHAIPNNDRADARRRRHDGPRHRSGTKAHGRLGPA